MLISALKHRKLGGRTLESRWKVLLWSIKRFEL